jgi:hypothetical protein
MDNVKKEESKTLPPPGDYPNETQRALCTDVHTRLTRRDIPAARIK